VNGSWQNSVPSPPYVTINNGDPISTINWGISAGANKSGYFFEADVPPPINIDVPPSPSIWLDLGDFIHFNYPVQPPILQEVDLRLDINMDVGATNVNRSFIYTINHNETTNTSNPYESRDIVTIFDPSADAFSVEGVLYTLELRFSKDGGNTMTNVFRTFENATNFAAIYGRFTSEYEGFISESVIVPPAGVDPVPEPSTMLLLGTGILGLAGFARKRFKRS